MDAAGVERGHVGAVIGEESESDEMKAALYHFEPSDVLCLANFPSAHNH